MSEIVKQTDLTEKISAQYKPYIEALRTPTLNHKDYVMVLKSIYLAIVNGMLLNGIGKADQDEGVIKYLSEKVFEQTKKKYPNSTVGQIKHAIEKYVLGEFADKFPKEQFISFNVANIFKSICLYQESNALLAAKREWISLIEMPKHDEENKPLNLNESLREPILNAYKEWLDTGKLPFTASSFYSVICQLKGVKTLINDKETRERIRQEAYNNYRESEVKKGTNRKSPELFENLLKWCLTKGMNPSYETETRRVALKEYFNYCKINNKEVV